MGIEGTSLKARAIVFALSVGAVAFILSVIPSLGKDPDSDLIWHAIIPSVIVAAMCWAAAERAIAVTAEAIDAAIRRMARAARGDLDSAIPPEVGEYVPELSSAMADLFAQLNTNLTSIERMALYDAVTGLPNRNHFRGQCELMLSRLAPEARAALLFIDLDRFKTVNDTLGHAAGDILLAQVAKRLNAVVSGVGASDHGVPLLGRLAGDEFTVFLPDAPDEAAIDRVGDAILATLSQPFDVHGHEIEIGASIGVARRPEHGCDLTDLMKAADAAMYQAKETGRGRMYHFDAMLAERINARAILDHDLRTAVAGRQFELVFQPQIASRTGRIVAAEALLRWRHPVDGLRLPGSFIQRAEDTGMIVEIGDWVVETIAETLARWADAGVEQRLSINLSARQVDHAIFFTRLREALAAAGAPPRLLELELNESLAMSCSDEALAALALLRRDGATVSMDGFGTGYSNLARLRMLPIDRVKLNRSVVAAVASEGAARAIVHALVGLIHGLGCEAVAEGVEDQAQADVLRIIGCDVMQGYAVAPPMGEREFLGWVRSPQASALVSTAA